MRPMSKVSRTGSASARASCDGCFTGMSGRRRSRWRRRGGCLLAKQLIHETSLPMAEVALASGFNSVRRFNETFLHLFGRSPASLRRIRDKTKREAGALSVRLRLPAAL